MCCSQLLEQWENWFPVALIGVQFEAAHLVLHSKREADSHFQLVVSCTTCNRFCGARLMGDMLTVNIIMELMKKGEGSLWPKASTEVSISAKSSSGSASWINLIRSNCDKWVVWFRSSRARSI